MLKMSNEEMELMMKKLLILSCIMYLVTTLGYADDGGVGIRLLIKRNMLKVRKNVNLNYGNEEYNQIKND